MTSRGLENVAKRYLIHAAACNLGLVMRLIFGHGTPKGMADALRRLIIHIFTLLTALFSPIKPRAHYQEADAIFSSGLMATSVNG